MRGAVRFRDLSNLFGRYAGDDGFRLYGSRHDGASSDDGPLTDGDAGQHDGPRANPHIVFNHDWLVLGYAVTRKRSRVSAACNDDVRRNQDAVANPNPAVGADMGEFTNIDLIPQLEMLCGVDSDWHAKAHLAGAATACKQTGRLMPGCEAQARRGCRCNQPADHTRFSRDKPQRRSGLTGPDQMPA
jgi:hypothetical protein